MAFLQGTNKNGQKTKGLFFSQSASKIDITGRKNIQMLVQLKENGQPRQTNDKIVSCLSTTLLIGSLQQLTTAFLGSRPQQL